jgi:hypothetical protein
MTPALEAAIKSVYAGYKNNALWSRATEITDDGQAARNEILGRALEAAAPLITDARWQALKDYLTGCIEADEAVRAGMVADGEDTLAAPFGGLVSANRATLAKMRELEKP